MAEANAILVYNFNEQAAAGYTINYALNPDYNGTPTGLTYSQIGLTSGEYYAELDADADNVAVNDFEELDGITPADGLSLFFKLSFNATVGEKQIFEQNGIFDATYNGTTGVFTFNLELTDGTASVSVNVITGSFISFAITYDTNGLIIWADGGITGYAPVITDATKTGNVETVGPSNSLYVGGSTTSARFDLSLLKIYTGILTVDEMNTLKGAINGLEFVASLPHGFAIGDIIAANLDEGTPVYAVVTHLPAPSLFDELTFSIQPISGTLTNSLQFNKYGNVYDTANDDYLAITENSICFYDNINAVADINNDANKVFCISKEGIIAAIKEVTTNYTVLAADNTLNVTAAVTVTLPLSPTTGKEYNIINTAGANNVVEIDGNGKEINGKDSLCLSYYDSAVLLYLGTEWIIK